MRTHTQLAGLLLFAFLPACSGSHEAAVTPVDGRTAASPVEQQASTTAQAYYVYVAAESQDEVALVRFDGVDAEVVETIDVSIWPTETDGPHGLAVDPDGEFWFVTIAHGVPYGRVVKYRTDTNEKVGEEILGLFPASMQISPSTGLLYVVNFNLHGKMEPSSISVVEPRTMSEIARVSTGIMPHGSRLSPDGRMHYSVAMMDGDLYEMEATRFEVTRILNTGSGKASSVERGDHRHAEGMSNPMKHDEPAPKPTWVHAHPTKPFVYVANNGSDEIIEVDLESWTISRRFKTQGAPYNLEVTPDGRLLVASQKKAGTTGVFELASGEEIARIGNSKRVTHGVAISPDSRYAFVSAEGIGGEPGAVDVIDLVELRLVATADVGMQAGGIAFWKKE